MEQIEYQEISNQELNRYLTNPASITFADAENIKAFTEKYPFCQLFHYFEALSLATKNGKTFDVKLAKAALYSPDRKTLYTIINNPYQLASLTCSAEKQHLQLVDDHQVEKINDSDVTIPIQADIYPESKEEITEEVYNTEIELIELTEEVHSENSAEVPENVGAITEHAINPDANSDAFLVEKSPVESDFILEELPDSEPESQTTESFIQEIEPEEKTVSALQSEEDKLILGNIATTNFFALEGSGLDIRAIEKKEATSAPITIPEDENAVETEEQVSKYDDDKLPYTFLWWLHKTRKEHAHTYQPYAPVNIAKHEVDIVKAEELNHQIIENIFHNQSPAPILENKIETELSFNRISDKNREEGIIEKFIKEEPQIKPPSPEKLDMENKARRSSEDPNDLVSETLAIIYTEQMLFHKAIDTYKKLSFKYPEKSTYFADQILKLEKKLN